jgi:hypothetical protein
MPTPEVIDPGHSIEDEKDGSSTTVTSRNGEVTKLANKRRGRAMSDRRCGASKGHKELPFITIFDSENIKYAERNEVEMNTSGSLVTLAYFQAAISRSTAKAARMMRETFKSAGKMDKSLMAESLMAVASRQWNEVKPVEKGSPQKTDSERWGWGKITLSDEIARPF